MRIKVIACKVLLRQLYRLAAESANTVEIVWLKQELHDTPELMRNALQDAIDRAEEAGDCDVIALAYGLCSNGTAGLSARKVPLVIARAHDCVTLFLGDKERYSRLFHEGNGGIYWYAQGWIENASLPSRARREKLEAEYIEKYGEDNAAYLMEMEQAWMKEYRHAVYVRWPSATPLEEARERAGETFTRESAAAYGWACRVEQGGDGLLRGLLDGPWDEERYLVVPPGGAIRASNDEGVLRV